MVPRQDCSQMGRRTCARGGLLLVVRIQMLCAVIFVLASLSLATATAGRAESIRMPFSCAMKGVVPKVAPAAPTLFEIVGERKTRTYTACREGGRSDCRTMMVHNFKIRCGRVTVPWAEVAARARGQSIGKSWMEDGQLNLLMANPNAKAAKKNMALFVMPVGYAPVVELGGRFVKSQDVGQSLDDLDTAGWEATSTMLEPAVLMTPSQEAASANDPIHAVLNEPGSTSSWQTIVYRAGETARPENSSWSSGFGASGFSVAIILMMATSLLAALGWFGARRYGLAVSLGVGGQRGGSPDRDGEASVSVPDWLRFPVGLISGFASKLQALWVAFKWKRLHSGNIMEWRNTSIANGARSTESLYEKAARKVQELGSASALRDTLAAELKTVRQRLDSLRDSNSEEVRTARVAAGLRGAVRDLERIGRIAESAAASLGRGRDELAIPKTRAEAFEVLGANPDVSEGGLKKIADALRMSWHPDHAKDETDKALREERTKQINIALDLIVAKGGR